MMSRWFLGFAVLCLVGCTTFSKHECEEMSWPTQGAKSAMQGKTLRETLVYYNVECGDKNEVVPDQAKLQAGYQEGLRYFCQPDNLRVFGSQGGHYKGTCKDDKESVQAYRDGHLDFVETEVDRLRTRVSDLENKISSLENDKTRLENDLQSCKR